MHFKETKVKLLDDISKIRKSLSQRWSRAVRTFRCKPCGTVGLQDELDAKCKSKLVCPLLPCVGAVIKYC